MVSPLTNPAALSNSLITLGLSSPGLTPGLKGKGQLHSRLATHCWPCFGNQRQLGWLAGRTHEPGCRAKGRRDTRAARASKRISVRSKFQAN